MTKGVLAKLALPASDQLPEVFKCQEGGIIGY